MQRLPTEQVVLLILQDLILVALVFRVLSTDLFRRYPSFFGYLLIASLQDLIWPFLPFYSVGYRYFWLVTQALLTCFCALVVLELYTLVLRDLKGIASTSRRYLRICLGVAIFGSLLLLLLERTPHGVFNTFMVIDRALNTSLLIFVLLLTTFLVYYPIPINRNLVVYSIGYAIYFTAKASSLLFLNIHQTWYRQFSMVVVTASTVAMLFWLLGLTRQGEENKLIIGHQWNPEDHEQMLARLKAINDSLLGGGNSKDRKG